MSSTSTARAEKVLDKNQTRYAVRKDAGHRPASMEFPADLYDRLQARSAHEERSMAAIVRQATREYLDRLGW